MTTSSDGDARETALPTTERRQAAGETEGVPAAYAPLCLARWHLRNALANEADVEMKSILLAGISATGRGLVKVGVSTADIFAMDQRQDEARAEREREAGKVAA